MVDELIQLLRRTEQHLYQHTVIAGDAVAFHHMGAALDIGVKLRLALGIHIQIDEGLDHIAQLRRIDLCLIGRDDVGAFQPGNAGRNSRAGQKHVVGDFLQGCAGVALQNVNDFAVDVVHNNTSNTSKSSRSCAPLHLNESFLASLCKVF